MVAADRKKRKTALENQYLWEYDDFKGINAEQKEVFKWIFLKQLIREAAIAADLKTLQYLMGHSDIGVTLNVYTHMGLDDAEKELQKMQGLENARKEMGISDKDDKPLKQTMFKVV